MKCILLIVIVSITALVGCGPKKHSSLYDFNSSLQPYLLTIVNKGVAGYGSAENYVEAHISDADLRKLSRSEHPVLRTVAFRIIILCYMGLSLPATRGVEKKNNKVYQGRRSAGDIAHR